MEQLENKILLESAANELRQGHWVRIRLVGDSMKPFLHEDTDILHLAPPSRTCLQVGHIVLARHCGDFCLHRIVYKKRETIHLQGDANTTIIEKISSNDVIAILVEIERNGHIIHCTKRTYQIAGAVWIYLRPLRRISSSLYSFLKLLYHTYIKKTTTNDKAF